MTTLNEIIETIKAENPTLKTGNDDDGYRELSEEEYAYTISQWAEARLEQQIKIQKEEEAKAAKAHERAALLARLGITEDEVRLLLGGN